MTKLTKEKLEKLIDERLEIFKNADEAVSKYNAEQETIKEYNGRQILELIQNADDAGAKTISIRLNTVNNELVFFNDGKAFDYEGIKSIMIANLSSKLSTSSYIGNKGLGFRSILNWAQSVTIYSAGLAIEFSRQVLEKYLNNQLQSLKSKLDEIRKDRNLSSTCIPIPTLGLPDVSESPHDECTETIGCALKIIYDESKEEDIINQIKTIDDRTLLFLPNINSVSVEIDTQKTFISDNEDEWNIYTNNKDELPDQYQDKNKNEKKKYKVKIAIPKSGLLDDASPLYNYLPSKEKVYLPFLLHATVELDSSRNHVNNTPVNDFILVKAAELICEITKKHLGKTQNRPDWIAYRMMTPTVSEKDYGSLEALYAKLDELKKDMTIYPTVNNTYVSGDDYCYYNDVISDFWKEFGVKEGPVSKMIQSKGDASIPGRDFPNVVDAFTKVSESIGDDLDSRVSFIRHLYKYKSEYGIEQSKLPLLIDNKGNVIDGKAYVQDSGEPNLAENLPFWVTFVVVNSELTKRMLDKFGDEISKEREDQKKNSENQQNVSEVRCLVRLLEPFVDIRYFDKTGIANQVVMQANDQLKEGKMYQEDLIGQMLDCLYKMNSNAKLKSVKLLNSDGEIKEADDLMLPNELNKTIFDGVDVEYVRQLEDWQKKDCLLEATPESYEDFMRNLGVNRLLKEDEVFGAVFYNGYNNYLASHKELNQAERQGQYELIHGSQNKKISVLRKSIMDRLEHVRLQQLLLFISSYVEVFDRLKESVELCFFFYRESKRWTPYNYVRYQLSSLPCVKWKVFGTNLILDDTVDVGKLAPDVKRKFVETIELIRTDFQYEEVNEIQQFLKDYSEKIRDGKNAQKLYKLIVDGWGERETGLKNVKLYASDTDGKKDFHPSEKVFYTSNTCLPKRVIEKLELFRLDYATRQAANNITKIFGLFRIEELNFKIVDHHDSDSSQEFDSFFRKLRPYFLLYAIQNASKDTSKATIAGYIKRCSIHLVSKCVYSIIGYESVDLDDGEFINAENDYYLKVPDGFILAEMKSSTTYCDAVMEILGMAFKLETKNEHFLHVFQGFDFMKRYIDETRKEDIEECFKLLGISTEEKHFWEKYGELKCLPLDFEAKDFYAQLPFDEQEVKRVNFSNWNNKESIDFLEKVLESLTTEEHKNKLLKTVDLSAWHKCRFDSVKTEYTRAFVHMLWTLLNEQYQDKRPEFFTLQDAYSQLSYENGWEHELKGNEDYLAALNEKVTELFNSVGISVIADLNESSPKDEPLNLYKKQIPSIQGEKDMEGERWRLYFNGNDAFISNYLDRLKNEDAPADADTTNDTEKVKGEFVEWGVGSKAHCPSPGKGKSKGSSVHTTKADRNKAKAGKEAEERVDRFLRNQERKGVCKYGEWVSKRDDSLGYDFTYTMDGQERLLEVKYSSDNTFSITGNEYAVAERNKDRYDIAIVDGDGKVTIYKSFFKGFPNISPKDYLVSFAVKDEGKNAADIDL